MKGKFSTALSLALIAAMLVTSLALAAELVTAEVTGTVNDVTVTQGTSVTSTINLSATGSISCAITSGNPSTATVDTSYSLNSAGILTTGSPSTAFAFYSNGSSVGGPNCGVTWTGDPTPYAATVTISAAATTPLGDYTVTLIDSAPGIDTTDVTNPSVSGGKLGDTTPTTVTVHVVAPPPPSDTTVPIITPNVNGTLGNNGWYVSDVTVSWSVVDNESTVTSMSGCDPTTINADTGGITLTCSATSAGGTASESVTIKRDATAPSISGSASPAPNGAGWNNTDVTVTFTCDDGLSGVATCSPNQSLSIDGAGQWATGNASDEAGNGASTTVSGINIDKTPPVVTVTGVTNAATYTLGSVPAAGCSTTDPLSGVAKNAALSLSGGPVGPVTAICSGAADFAGNSGYASVTYNVIYNWTGFFQPVDNNAVNTVKAGSAIPVKFSLGGYQGLGIFAVGYPKFVRTSCTTGLPEDAIETTVTAGGSSLTYDALAGQYIYVWKTEKSWVGACGVLQVTLIDGTVHTASFKLK